MITKEKLKLRSENNPIILFDGDCILCSRIVQWIIKNDAKDVIRFCTLQNAEDETQEFKNDFSTVILLDKGKLYEKSAVSFVVLKYFGGIWFLLLPLWLIPSFIRNGIYNVISQNRYKWFGKEENCLLMTDEIKSKFIS